MLSLIDPAAMAAALPTLDQLPRRRVEDILNSQLADMTHILIMEPGDTEHDIIAEIGFSPIEVEGIWFGQPGFRPAWDILHDHGDWFEMVFCIGNCGFAVIIFTPEREGADQAGLAEVCRGWGGGHGNLRQEDEVGGGAAVLPDCGFAPPARCTSHFSSTWISVSATPPPTTNGQRNYCKNKK